jgi:hypothetical protein
MKFQAILEKFRKSFRFSEIFSPSYKRFYQRLRSGLILTLPFP